jgi:hypothetical protein
MARGILLIVVAVALGVVLLRATDSPEPFEATSSGRTETTDRGTTPATDEEADTTTTTAEAAVARDPSEVTILVANGSGMRGAAGRVADTLKGSNYVTAPSVNAKEPAEASTVFYAPGYEADAAAIAGLLTPAPGVQPMPDPLPVDDLSGAQVLIVVAADLAGSG